jgi:hypothetical protein
VADARLCRDGTDLVVAAGARNGAQRWVYVKRATGPTIVERTYRFAPSY